MTSEDYDNYWCTMSPARWYNGKNSYWVIGGNDRPGRPMYASGVGYSGVRPVISLSSCVKIKSGIGTPDSPYEIDESSCS